MNIYLLTIYTAIFLMLHTDKLDAERDQFMYCGACLCMVEEMGWHLGATDGKKTIQLGSFRLDERGNQKGAVEVPFKRSEVHMIELMEGICSTMHDYHIQTNPNNGRKSFVRTSSRMGEAISLTNVMISKDTTTQLRFSCDTLLEEHEDNIIEMFQNEEKNMEEKLCVDLAKVCTLDDVEAQRWGTVDAIVTGMKEQMSGGVEEEEEEWEYEDDDEDWEYEDDEDDEYADEEEEDEYANEDDDEYANEEDEGENEDGAEIDRMTEDIKDVVTEASNKNRTNTEETKVEL